MAGREERFFLLIAHALIRISHQILRLAFFQTPLSLGLARSSARYASNAALRRSEKRSRLMTLLVGSQNPGESTLMVVFSASAPSGKIHIFLAFQEAGQRALAKENRDDADLCLLNLIVQRKFKLFLHPS
jgi:hypothetical protein